MAGSKKRKRPTATLYNHAEALQNAAATARTEQIDLKRRRQKATVPRNVQVDPSVVNTLDTNIYFPLYQYDDEETEQLQTQIEDVVVHTTTKARRYLNSVRR